MAAKAELATVSALEECPHTRAAVEAGEVSLVQAREIAGAVAVVPESEAGLLDTARSSGMAGLRDEARRLRLRAVEVGDLHREQHRRREVRHWRDELGMVCLHAALPPEVGVPLVNRLDVTTDRLRRQAKHAVNETNRVEPRAAYAADALIAMTSELGSEVVAKRSPRAEVVLVADVHALARGRSEADEPCHIVGGGPVPLSVVSHALVDAFVKLVTHDGTKIDSVVHVGRKVPAVLRTALELGAPPRFDGVTCVEEGCDRKYGLEWDHVDPVANNGPSAYDNLQPRCWPCHRAKTERDRAAGLLRRRAAAGEERAPP
jgi:hypothetical protein